jgi:hypothetical protein
MGGQSRSGDPTGTAIDSIRPSDPLTVSEVTT